MNRPIVSTLSLLAIIGASVSPVLAGEDVRAHAQVSLKTGIGQSIGAWLHQFRQERNDDREQSKEERTQDREEYRNELASKSQELKRVIEAKRDQGRRALLERFWEKTVARLQKFIDREQAVSDRIRERMEKFEALKGKKFEDQKKLLKKADDAIDDAQDSLDHAKASVSASFEDEDATVADIIAGIRTQHRTVIDALRVGHAALVDVIVSLRGASLTASVSASVSPTATP